MPRIRMMLTSGLAIAAAMMPLSPAWAQYYRDHGMGGWGHLMFGGLTMVIFWGLVIALIVLLVRWLGGAGSGDSRPSGRPRPLEILEERFAKGEIDAEEFQERKKHLSK